MEMHLHIRSGIIRQSVNRRWKRLDFLCAVTTEPGKCYPGDDPYALTRVRMLGSQSLDQFISEIN